MQAIGGRLLWKNLSLAHPEKICTRNPECRYRKCRIGSLGNSRLLHFKKIGRRPKKKTVTDDIHKKERP